MIGHVSIGVRDVATTKRFYDAAFKPLGYQCLSEGKDSLGYGRGTVAFWISTAAHPVPPDMQSGLHFCFTAPTPKSVDAFHAAALASGGRDNGMPGLRADYGLLRGLCHRSRRLPDRGPLRSIRRVSRGRS
jgi:catechol 2,3-dioxygenase-like lactoylglutathione lyase family enzyme